MDYVASFGKEKTALPSTSFSTSFSTSTVKDENNMGNEGDYNKDNMKDDDDNNNNLILNGNDNDSVNEDIDIIDQIEVI